MPLISKTRNENIINKNRKKNGALAFYKKRSKILKKMHSEYNRFNEILFNLIKSLTRI